MSLPNITLPQTLLVIAALAAVILANLFAPGAVAMVTSVLAPLLTTLVYSPLEKPLGAPPKDPGVE